MPSQAAVGGKRSSSNLKMPSMSSFTDRVNPGGIFRIILCVFGAVLIVFVLIPVLHGFRGQSTKDYWVWFETGKTILRGEELYPDPRWHKFPFMYPPPCALFLTPLSALGQNGLIIVLALVIAAAWIYSIIFSV